MQDINKRDWQNKIQTKKKQGNECKKIENRLREKEDNVQETVERTCSQGNSYDNLWTVFFSKNAFCKDLNFINS